MAAASMTGTEVVLRLSRDGVGSELPADLSRADRQAVADEDVDESPFGPVAVVDGPFSRLIGPFSLSEC